jgi:hypothetical protein
MPFAFSGARPLTRVWNKTGGSADAVSSLAAVFTVKPLYDLARQAGSGGAHMEKAGS